MRVTLRIVLALICSSVIVLSGQQDEYSKLVTQARSDLSAGHAAEALNVSEKAISLNSSRWEAYLVAAGALQAEKQFDAATDNFAKALDRAPESKKAAIRSLLEQCTREKLGLVPTTQPVAPSSVTTQAEIVLWKTIENSNNIEDFKTYISKYPDGPYVPLATHRISSLQTRLVEERAREEDAQKSRLAEESKIVVRRNTSFMGSGSDGYILISKDGLSYVSPETGQSVEIAKSDVVDIGINRFDGLKLRLKNGSKFEFEGLRGENLRAQKQIIEKWNFTFSPDHKRLSP